MTTQMLFVLLGVCAIGLATASLNGKSNWSVVFVVAGAAIGINLILRLI